MVKASLEADLQNFSAGSFLYLLFKVTYIILLLGRARSRVDGSLRPEMTEDPHIFLARRQLDGHSLVL